ncbi:xanthine dehydrogenase subunit D [Niallia sp. FSL W8-0635]|uniref:xanthine dehydrogenase subunit D n=1 Tax=Niallia sp. FSL W8-0635 TaxID=2975337 RepID=UPI0009CEC73B|nr:aerobic-type carbon monoxide dehydrogenase, large subunit CoxL/CutL-like protein [Mycobacteroides abscessus subsp. abscessus]HEO8418272.1 xanthine dehydrogenase subunit D [Yersinia enterocolitica]
MVLDITSAGARWKIRRDGEPKVTGRLKYLTDMSFPQMLYGTVLRSEHPHAKIESIDTKEAEELPGVASVITYRDVPGLNGFGIVIQDQPVLCEDKVRYVGDAVAAVAAETKEIAQKAISLIKVKYTPLQPVTDPEEALRDTTIKLHKDGNLLHQAAFQKGERQIEKSFKDCAFIVEEIYHTPRQMHAYMETEGGVAVPGSDGGITVYAPTQHGFKDQLQLSRILSIPPEKIRIISSPIGGSFGGKDELNIQPYITILALKTKRPVKIHQSRRVSIKAGLKRHPMKIYMKTGTDTGGKLLAHQVKIFADTGAYATLGPAVLDFAVEHSAGPYRIENVDVKGYSIYTNNGVAGEFRGFGGNQITFALETQIERLAEKIGISSTEFRMKNLRQTEDPGPVEQPIVPTDGAKAVLTELIKSPILQKKTDLNAGMDWKLKGRGYSITMHGGGLGYGRPDPSGARLSLNEEGKLEVSFGFEECGQGLISTIDMIMTETFNCDTNDVEITIGDTAKVPHSGSSTASRATNMVWLGVNKLKAPFIEKVLAGAEKQTNVSSEKLSLGKNGIWIYEEEKEEKLLLTYKELASSMDELPSVTTSYHFPTTPQSIDGGHFLYTFAGVAVEVEVDLLTGRVAVTKMDHVISAGPVVNPMGYLGQIEGGANMGLGFTLMEDAAMENGRYMTENLDTYLIPTILDIPKETKVFAIEDLVSGDTYGPRGVGEIGTVAVAPAIVSAIHDATGMWLNKLPIQADTILKAVEQKILSR